MFKFFIKIQSRLIDDKILMSGLPGKLYDLATDIWWKLFDVLNSFNPKEQTL